MDKREIPVSSANRLINSGPVILVTSIKDNQPNIITLAWNTPLSHSPMLVGISIGKGRYSHAIIENSKEFIINVPSLELLEKVHQCGTISGREGDKFKAVKLTPDKALKLKVPIITECIGHLECKVKDIFNVGDHSLFVGQVVAASAAKDFFDACWQIDKVHLIAHLGGNKYQISGKAIQVE